MIPPRVPRPASLALAIGLLALLLCPGSAAAQGVLRPTTVPEGWPTEQGPEGGFQVRFEEHRQGEPALGTWCIVFARWWDRRSFASPEEIAPWLAENVPGAAVEPLTVGGHPGALAVAPLVDHGGGQGEAGFFHSEYSQAATGLVQVGNAVVEVHFTAGAKGGYSNSNQAEVQATGRERIAQARSILQGITLSLDAAAPAPGAGRPAKPPPLWQYVVGAGAVGLALLVAAAAAIALAAKGRKVTGYVLQVSRDQIDLGAGTPESVELTVWEVDPAGGHRPAPGACLTVTQPPESRAYLQVTPLAGQSRMTCTVSGCAPVETVLQVLAQAGGTSHRAELRVRGGLGLEAWVLRGKQADVAWRPDSREWLFPEIVGYFHGGDHQPVAPPFSWYFPEPRLTCSPDLLEVREVYLHDERTQAWTVRVGLRPGVDLLEDGALVEWLHRDGRLAVTVHAEAHDGRRFQAQVAYRMVPRFELRAWSYQETWRQPSGHVYRNLSLGPDELAVDGSDELRIAAGWFRTDDPRPLPLPFRVAGVAGARLAGIEEERFLVQEQPAPDGDPVFLWVLRSREPLLLTRSRASGSLRLELELGPRPPGSQNCTLAPVAPHPLKPLFLFLKLWISPGRSPGTSEACAFVALPPSVNRPLLGAPIRLRVEGLGSGSLAIGGPEESATDGRGLTPTWTLRYSGLDWDNVREARFRVLCGVSGGREAHSRVLDVGANALALLADLHQARGRLALDNPDFHAGRASVVPPLLRGPLVNFVHAANPARFNGFICADYATRLRNWLLGRRFGPDPGGADPNRELDVDACFAMNGVEVEEYSVRMLLHFTHHFAGLYLSGASATAEPRFVDPWWSQHWDSPAYRTLEGLDTPRTEIAYVTAAHASAALLVSLLYAVALASAWLTVMDLVSCSILSGFHASGIVHAASAHLSIGVYRDARVLDDAGEYDSHHREWPAEGVRFLAARHRTLPPAEEPVPW